MACNAGTVFYIKWRVVFALIFYDSVGSMCQITGKHLWMQWASDRDLFEWRCILITIPVELHPGEPNTKLFPGDWIYKVQSIGPLDLCPALKANQTQLWIGYIAVLINATFFKQKSFMGCSITDDSSIYCSSLTILTQVAVMLLIEQPLTFRSSAGWGMELWGWQFWAWEI